MAQDAEAHHDPLEEVLAGWARELPGVDLGAVSISLRISRLGLLFDRAVEELVRPHGFGFGELEVLFYLLIAGREKGLRPSDLTRGCLVTSGAMTGRVDRLAKAGLVDRIPSLVDRREMVVRLTRTGEKLARRLQHKVAVDSPLAMALATLDPAQKAVLDQALQVINARVEPPPAEGATRLRRRSP